VAESDWYDSLLRYSNFACRSHYSCSYNVPKPVDDIDDSVRTLPIRLQTAPAPTPLSPITWTRESTSTWQPCLWAQVVAESTYRYQRSRQLQALHCRSSFTRLGNSHFGGEKACNGSSRFLPLTNLRISQADLDLFTGSFKDATSSFRSSKIYQAEARQDGPIRIPSSSRGSSIFPRRIVELHHGRK